jgi:HSP20 family protein
MKRRRSGMRSLIPWRRREPAALATRSVDDLHREFDDFFNDFFGSGWLTPRTDADSLFAPAFDISETDEDLLVKADLPGIDPTDVSVNLSGNVLTVKGERNREREEKSESVHRIERSFGSFSRSLTLPFDVDEENVKATYEKGVLTLQLPRAESAKKKTIKIDVA